MDTLKELNKRFKMLDLSNLTLIIPTYTRQRDVLRLMKFWSDIQVNVHVLDGTDTSIKTDDLTGLGENVQYHHIPKSIEERIKLSLDLIDTPYVALLCDDEFFIPSALENCINYLKKNDAVACIGRCLNFRYSKKGIIASPMYTEMKNYKIEHPVASQRMIAHMSPYIPSTIYAVQHSDVWKNSMKILASDKYRFSCPYVGELQIELATCYQGKSIVMEDLMWLRNKDNKPINFKLYNRKLQFNEWIRDYRFRDEVELFYEITSTELAKIDKADKEKVLNDLKLAINAYITYSKKKYPLLRIAEVKEKILNYIPEKARKHIEDFTKYRYWKPIMDQVKIMQNEGVNIDMKQLQEIVKYMCN